MKVIKIFSIILFSVVYAKAQVQLPIEPIFQNTYNKETRSVSGKPGKNYWQNSSKYDLKVDFNPSTRLLKGKVD
ncbi:MAG: peptidase, partial [Pedobacter sp.]